jgi:hypothetical protein
MVIRKKRKRESEREREFPRLDLSRTLQKSSAPAICDGRKKKEKEKNKT